MKYLVICTFLLTWNFPLWAEDHADSGHGGAKKPEAHSGPIDDYFKDVSVLEQAAGQIFSLEKTIKEKIEEKNKTKDKEKLKEILADIKKELTKRSQTVEKYQKMYNHIRYNHPEKGKLLEARYKKIDAKHEKEFEDEINGILSNIMSDVRRKYPTAEEK